MHQPFASHCAFFFLFFFFVSHSHNSWRPWFSRTVRRSWELLASQIGNCASTKTRLRQQRWLYITVELIMSCRRTKHSINISYKNEVPIVFLTWLKKPKWWTRQDKNGNTDFLCQHREHVHPSLSSSLFFSFFSLPSVPLLSSGSWLRGCRCCCDAAFWGFVPATCLRMEKMFMCSGTLYPPYTQFLSGQKRLWNMYLNRWTPRYSGKIKRISFLVYHWKKKVFSCRDKLVLEQQIGNKI